MARRVLLPMKITLDQFRWAEVLTQLSERLTQTYNHEQRKWLMDLHGAINGLYPLSAQRDYPDHFLTLNIADAHAEALPRILDGEVCRWIRIQIERQRVA
jgi:hypothetical protein